MAAARAASDACARAEATARVSGVPVAAALRAQDPPPGDVDPRAFNRALAARSVAAASLDALTVPHSAAQAGGGIKVLSSGIAEELAEVASACIGGGRGSAAGAAPLAVPPLPASSSLAAQLPLQLSSLQPQATSTGRRRGFGASRQRRTPLAVAAGGGTGKGRRGGGGRGAGEGRQKGRRRQRGRLFLRPLLLLLLRRQEGISQLWRLSMSLLEGQREADSEAG